MGNYRSKPVDVEAVQYDGRGECARAIHAWVSGDSLAIPPEDLVTMGQQRQLMFLYSGHVSVKPGQWVVQVSGSDTFVVFDDAEFKRQFEVDAPPIAALHEALIRDKVRAPIEFPKVDAVLGVVARYVVARTVYEEATRPNGSFGHPRALKHSDPIGAQYREARQELSQLLQVNVDAEVAATGSTDLPAWACPVCDRGVISGAAKCPGCGYVQAGG